MKRVFLCEPPKLGLEGDNSSNTTLSVEVTIINVLSVSSSLVVNTKLVCAATLQLPRAAIRNTWGACRQVWVLEAVTPAPLDEAPGQARRLSLQVTVMWPTGFPDPLLGIPSVTR